MDHPKEEITKILGLLKNWRRDLHMIPEPGSEVTKTRSYIHSVLKKMNCRIIPAAQNGICAFFDFDRPDTAAKPRMRSIARPGKASHPSTPGPCMPADTTDTWPLRWHWPRWSPPAGIRCAGLFSSLQKKPPAVQK